MLKKQPLDKACSLIKKEAAAWGLQLYEIRISDTGIFLWISRNFKNTFFIAYLRATAYEHWNKYKVILR